jgi:hypothetical protein
MLRQRRRGGIIVCGIALVVLADIAQAQGIFLARRAIGRIEQMSQSAPNGNTTYDTATVIVEVPADKVYATVQKSVRAAQGITVTRDDTSTRRIEFTDGTRIAGIQAISLGDNVSQLMVSSAHSSASSAPTPTIVEHIVAACKQMNVECSRGP